MGLGAEVRPTAVGQGIDGIDFAWIGIAITDNDCTKRRTRIQFGEARVEERVGAADSDFT